MNSEFRVQHSASHGLSQFERNGFQVIPTLVEPWECELLAAELTAGFEKRKDASKSKIGGLRNLLATNLRVSQFAKSRTIISILKTMCGSILFPVRAIFFDKNPDANWRVPWHQDLAIAVTRRMETPGFTGWSIKDGIPHVHPPREILENMVTVRLHLDDCEASNGALKVIPGSHLHGKLGAADITRWTTANEAAVCELEKGDALLMRPLLLHASSPAEKPMHRRVLHVEYAAQNLPDGLTWRDC